MASTTLATTDVSAAIEDTGVISAVIDGTVDGYDAVKFDATSGLSTIVVGPTGVLSADGGHDIYSYAGAATIVNYGTMVGAGSQTIGIVIHQGTIRNYGTIQATEYAILGSGGSLNVTNDGGIDGDVDLGDAGRSTFDSTLGTVDGVVSTNSDDGATIVLGTNGGTAVGGAGDDNLQANPSATAADNHAQFTLDGAGGANALYGGGAFNTFDAGDASGGHNQIHGGASQMTGVSGDANNTINFVSTPAGQSVYVDLLSGHNAYLYANAGHSGALTFEDWIQNVPNVIGSAGGDLIRADNGTDIIAGGAGGDILYAGTGFDTFVYKGYADSNTLSGYDTISGFVTGKDKVDLSALNSDPSHLAIRSGSASTTLYLEATPGKFTPSTDLAISVTGANAIKASDVIL